MKELGSRASGLSEAEADSRWKKIGPNEIAREKRQSALMRLLANLKNPLVLLLVALGELSYAVLTQVVKTWFIRRFGD